MFYHKNLIKKIVTECENGMSNREVNNKFCIQIIIYIFNAKMIYGINMKQIYNTNSLHSYSGFVQTKQIVYF